MNSISAADQHDPASSVRLVVGLHVALGLLLIWLDPLLSLFNDEVANLVAFRVTFPLLPCVGLFWMLVAALLVSRQRWVVRLSIFSHSAALLALLAGIVLGSILLIAGLSDDGRTGHSVGAGLAPFLGGVLLVYSVIAATFGIVAIILLRRQLRNPEPLQGMLTRPACVVAAIGVVSFAASVGGQLVRDAQNRATIFERESTIAHESDISVIIFSPDGTQIATASETGDQFVRVWDASSGDFVSEVATAGPVHSMIWVPNGNFLVIGGRNLNTAGPKGELLLYEPDSGTIAPDAMSEAVTALAASSDGNVLAAGLSTSVHGWGDSAVMLYGAPTMHVRNFTVPAVWTDGPAQITTMAFAMRGRKLIVGGYDGLMVWNRPLTSESVSVEKVSTGGPVRSLVVSPDDTQLFVGLGNGRLLRYSLPDLEESELQGGSASSWISQIAITSDGKLLAVGSQDRTVKVIDLHTDSVVHQITEDAGVTAVAISPDDSLLAVGSARRVRLYDMERMAFVRELIQP